MKNYTWNSSYLSWINNYKESCSVLLGSKKHLWYIYYQQHENNLGGLWKQFIGPFIIWLITMLSIFLINFNSVFCHLFRESDILTNTRRKEVSESSHTWRKEPSMRGNNLELRLYTRACWCISGTARRQLLLEQVIKEELRRTWKRLGRLDHICLIGLGKEITILWGKYVTFLKLNMNNSFMAAWDVNIHVQKIKENILNHHF